MKLVRCTKCRDIVKLELNEDRSCTCGKSGGRYTDKVNAVYWGSVTLLGFDTTEFETAIENQPASGPMGIPFTAFVIPRDCPTFKRVKPPKKRRNK